MPTWGRCGSRRPRPSPAVHASPRRRAWLGLCRRHFGRIWGADGHQAHDARRRPRHRPDRRLTLGTGDRFDILAFGSLKGRGFDALALDGVACSSPSVDRWTCGGGVRLNEMIDATSLDLVVAHASAGLGPAGPSPIPEPIDLGDARVGLPRPRRPQPAQTQEGGRDRATVTRPRHGDSFLPDSRERSSDSAV